MPSAFVWEVSLNAALTALDPAAGVGGNINAVAAEITHARSASISAVLRHMPPLWAVLGERVQFGVL
jgi:hypothetical protein